jgi:hypothetical protein
MPRLHAGGFFTHSPRPIWQRPELDRRVFTPDFDAGVGMRVERLPARGRAPSIFDLPHLRARALARLPICQNAERSIVVDFGRPDRKALRRCS